MTQTESTAGLLPVPGPKLEDRRAGILLGTALGDALGLPAEGLSAAAVARRFGRVDRFHLLGQTGFVSDDTEQAALVAQALIRQPTDPAACAGDFRRALLGWFARLPWGIGLATLRSCLRSGAGLRPSGVRSAGNGAAMRAAVVGGFFYDCPRERRAFGTALAEVTHLDQRAVEGALYAAELAAACIRCPDASRGAAVEAVEEARAVVTEPCLSAALDRARELAAAGAPTEKAAELGTSGYTPHTVAFATFCFLRFGEQPVDALAESIGAGGDTDSIGAVLGAWLGARHGESGLPAHLLERIHDGPFGPTHLRALARALAAARSGTPVPAPPYSPAAAIARNLALWPVVLGHGFRRLFPW